MINKIKAHILSQYFLFRFKYLEWKLKTMNNSDIILVIPEKIIGINVMIEKRCQHDSMYLISRADIAESIKKARS
jgi:hypothetical protein